MRIAYYLLTTIFYYLLRPYLYLRILKKKNAPPATKKNQETHLELEKMEN